MTLEKHGCAAVRAIDRAPDIALEIILCVALLFGLYSLWDSKQVYQAADAANYVAYRPDADEGLGFAELRRLNPEVFAWLTVNDTPIDYPVARTDNNEKYINTNAKGEYTLSGSIFLDYRNSPDFDDFNSILYGHHMEKKKMFGALSDFADRAYFDAHPYGNLYFGGKDHGIDFFALVLTDAYDSTLFSPAVAGEGARQAYLDRILARATWTRDIPLSTEDQIIVLSTCTSTVTNGRYLLFGKLSDELHPWERATNAAAHDPGLSPQLRGLTRLPAALWLGLLALLIWLLVRVERKIDRNRSNEKRKITP
jgi:sortase B